MTPANIADRHGTGRSCLYWLLGALLCSTPAGANGDPNALERRLERVASGMQHDIRFEERRHSEILSEPAVYTGRLGYDPDNAVMRKQVLSPEAIEMQVSEREIRVNRNGETRRISLRQRPELRALLSTFRALLDNDPADLERYFTTHYLESDGDVWRLALTPGAAVLARRLDSILIIGKGDRVAFICTYLANGDWQSMRLLLNGSGATDPVTDAGGEPLECPSPGRP